MNASKEDREEKAVGKQVSSIFLPRPSKGGTFKSKCSVVLN